MWRRQSLNDLAIEKCSGYLIPDKQLAKIQGIGFPWEDKGMVLWEGLILNAGVLYFTSGDDSC